MFYIKSGETMIFDPSRVNELPVSEAKISEKLNEGGAVSFTLVKGHPSYDKLEPMATYITVYENEDIVWYGRVMEQPLPSFSCQIKYECEGAISFLNDSEVPPSKNTRTMTPEAFFRFCIEKHNEDINNDPRRTFTAGIVSIDGADKSENFSTSSYSKTKDTISSNLLNVYGGYLRIRNENGIRYLDWVKNYTDTVNPQQIKVGINILERGFNTSSEDIFTYIRPVGKNGLLLDEPTIRVFPEELVTKYGRIVRSVTFSDISNKTQLLEKANEYISRLKAELLCSGEISILEMKYIDGTSPMVRIGDRFNNLEGLEGREFTVTDLERDLSSPYQAQASFGNDKSLNSSRSGSISKSSGRSKANTAQNFKHIIEVQSQVTINADKLVQQGQTLDTHYELIRQTQNSYERLSVKTENLEGVTSQQGNKIQAIEGTGVIQNDELLTHFAGTMNIVRDPSTGKVKGLQFVDGTMVCDTVDGHTVTVGKAIADNTTNIDGVKVQVQTIEGSALWTEREHITGVCGEYDVITDPVTGNKTLVIKSGGGIKIRRDSTEFGLYDSGNLTGGIMVEKINDNTTTTKIKGDRVQITATQLAEFGLVDPQSGKITAGIIAELINNQDPSQGTVTTIKGDKVIIGNMGSLSGDSIETWMQNAYHGQGVFAKFLTVKELTAEQITTLLANIKNATIDELSTTKYIKTPAVVAYSSVETDSVYAAKEIVLNNNLLKVIDASVSGNILTITKLNNSGEVETINFSKATSLFGSWSGSTLTIGASPQGNEYTIGISDSGVVSKNQNLFIDTGTTAINPTNSKLLNIPIYVKTFVSGSPPTITERYSKTFTVDATSVYNAGNTAGKNSVKVKAFTADARTGALNDHRTFTYATDAPSPVSGSSQVDTWYLASDANWSSNKKTVYLRYLSSTGTNYAQLSIDASSVYNSGYSDGTTAGKNAVTLNNPTWTYGGDNVGLSNTITVTTNGRPTQLSKTASFNLTQDTNWSNKKKMVYARKGTSTTGEYAAKIEIDATSVYNSGYSSGETAGYNSAVSKLQTKTFATNGTKSPDSGYIGFSSVTVNVPNSTEIGNFTANGTYVPSEGKIGFNSVVINVPNSVTTKTITANGTYTPSSGYIGFSSVMVNVPQSASITADGYDNPDTDITGSIYAKNGDAILDTKSLFMNNGSWNNGKIAVNARVGTTSGNVTSRLWLSVPTPTGFAISTLETPSGYTRCDSSKDFAVTSVVKSIYFTVGGKKYYIRVHRG